MSLSIDPARIGLMMPLPESQAAGNRDDHRDGPDHGPGPGHPSGPGEPPSLPRRGRDAGKIGDLQKALAEPAPDLPASREALAPRPCCHIGDRRTTHPCCHSRGTELGRHSASTLRDSPSRISVLTSSLELLHRRSLAGPDRKGLRPRFATGPLGGTLRN